ncbi:hypothetical protein OG302_23790 [Streptomyces sp. NBC_01283]|uniref:hypothetical protein n=1 Tax=Streptomyces sp. NBC_01283 TaxID=2903812 RepID=UPI00352E6CA6|nr:hypothetical protein OG302_01400 [Streptomyces sp. NBC_01283]WSL21987.1 hypothetical protein OG302_23790 [Streptomyces sp. NBC_01283]
MPAPPDDPLQPLSLVITQPPCPDRLDHPDLTLNNDYVTIKSEANRAIPANSRRPGERSWTPH